jgi:ketosteroid isomerase-like protein
MRKLIPAAVMMLVVPIAVAAHAIVPPSDSERGLVQGDTTAIVDWFKAYDGAFNAKDLEKLADHYHSDVTIYEGGGIDSGWAAYRDKHLGPELKAFENLQFAHHDVKVQLLDGGNAAYVTARYTLKAKMGERDIDSEGLATHVLVRGTDAAWKIRHSHTSSRPVRRPAAQ